MIHLTIGPMEAGKPVHRYLRQLLSGVPLSGIHKMIRTGRVKRAGKKLKADDRLEAGDEIVLYMAEEDYEAVSRPSKKFGGISSHIDVVYEDNQLLAVNKPVGLLTHGAMGEHKDTLVNRVLAYLHRKGELKDRRFTPASVNRLDRNTSGIVLFGKSGEAVRSLANDIAENRIHKWYIAIVSGEVPELGEINAPLARDERSNRTSVSESGRDSLTRYRRLASAGNTSVVGIELVSGRTHQIRAHFAHIGHPLWGDVKYGKPAPNARGAHQWLHAGRVTMADGRELSVSLPEAYEISLAKLGYSRDQLRNIDDFVGAQFRAP